ncbi:MAG: hypothetical protein V5A18_00800 [Haloarculaceae archaeon]
MSDRGVSDLIGYVLVFSLVASSVAIVSIGGLDSLENARSVEQVNNAERALDVLADNMEDLFREGAPSRASEVTLEAASFQTSDKVIINISGNQTGGPNFSFQSQSNVLVWESQGGRDTELRYAFGTVIRNQRAGGVVLREPPFEFGDERTILPIVQTRTRNPQSLAGGKIRVRGVRLRSVVVWRGDASFDRLHLNVTTPAPDIWEEYLEVRDQVVDCERQSVVDPEKTKVYCEFETDELYIIKQPVRVMLER